MYIITNEDCILIEQIYELCRDGKDVRMIRERTEALSSDFRNRTEGEMHWEHAADDIPNLMAFCNRVLLDVATNQTGC